jgi:hypothetical protein
MSGTKCPTNIESKPDTNRGFEAIGSGRTHPLVYDQLTTDHPIDLTRWQVANNYMGRVGLINSGGASKGKGDLAQAVRTAQATGVIVCHGPTFTDLVAAGARDALRLLHDEPIPFPLGNWRAEFATRVRDALTRAEVRVRQEPIR